MRKSYGKNHSDAIEVRGRVCRSKDERKPIVLVNSDHELLMEKSQRELFLLLPSNF
jgi:hypothetical protein